MKTMILGVLLSFSLLGCATTSGLDAKTTTSDFDKSKRVSIAPHGSVCTNNYATCALLGFTWTDKKPEQSNILVQVTEPTNGGEYHSIITTKLNIDGDIITLKPSIGDTNSFDYNEVFKTSSRLYDVPLSTLNKVKLSKITKIQVIADGAIIEGDLKDGDKNTKAYHAMLRFLDQI